MKRIIVFEERGGTDDPMSPARIATGEATKWINAHNAEVLHMAVAIFVDHERGLEDYTITLMVRVPEEARDTGTLQEYQQQYEETVL